MDSRRLEQCRRWLYSTRPILGRFLTRAALRALRRNLSRDSVRLLADALTKHEDTQIRKLVLETLHQVKTPHSINAFCESWFDSRHHALEKLLKWKQWVASKPIELQVFSALKTSQHKDLLSFGVPVVSPLFHAACDRDSEVSARATEILGNLKDVQQIEALCDQLTRMDPGPLHKLAVQKGYRPKDPAKRALFYFLTGQYEMYDGLDFDHSLLRACYETGESDVRHSIAARIRTSGRTELTEVLHGQREKRQLAEMTPREWETVVSVLRERKRYSDLWALVFEAPTEWSSEILRILHQANFRPASDWDRKAFDKLLKLRPAEGKHLRLYLPTPWCQSVLNTQEHGVRSLAMSPDGKKLAVVNSDTTTFLWNLGNVRTNTSITKRVGLALSVAFSPDGRTLAVGNADNVARIWDISNWRMNAAYRGHTDRISSIGISTDNSTIGTASYDKTVRLWDVKTHECRSVLTGHQQSVLALAFSPDCQYLATGSHDETARIWYIQGGGNRFTLTGKHGSICSVAFSPDGRTLATGSSDGTVRLWHVASGEIKAVLQGQKGSVMALTFSQDGTRLAAGSLDRSVAIWDVPSAKLKSLLRGHQDEVHAVAFLPDGKSLVSGSRDRTIRIWQIAEKKSLINMDHDDLEHIQHRASAASSSLEARPWHFSAALLRHRFRFDIELAEIAERVFGEFEIEIEDAPAAN